MGKPARKPTKKPFRTKPIPSTAQEPPKTIPEDDKIVPLKAEYKKALSRLPARRRVFVQEYLIDRNGTEAAKRAHYSAHTAQKQGTRMLGFVAVKEAIAAGAAVIAEENKDRFEEAMAELRLVAFSNIEHYVTVDPNTGAIQCKGFEDMPAAAARAIESIQEDRIIKESSDGKQIILNDKRKFKLHNKVTALVAYIDRLKPPEQKLNVTVSGLTMFPPEPKTMEEYEKLVRSSKV